MTRTLGQIIDACLPDVPRRRYSDAFWIAKANFVLDELTTKLFGPYRETEVLVPLVEGVTRYRIPKGIRRPTRIRYPNGHPGIQTEDTLTGTNFVIIGDDFRLLYAPIMDSNETLVSTQQLPNGDSRQTTEIWDYTNQASWPDVTNRGAVVIHYKDRASQAEPLVESSREYSFIAGLFGTGINLACRLNGELQYPAKDGDTLNVISNFLIVSGPRSLTHFSTIDDVSPLPTEFDRVLGKGLFYYLLMSLFEDGSGPSVGMAEQAFRNDVEELVADHTHQDGDQYPARPRNAALYGDLGRRRR